MCRPLPDIPLHGILFGLTPVAATGFLAGARYQIRTGDNCLEGSYVTTTPTPHIFAAYSAATALSRARNCLVSFATMRAFPPFFVSLSSLSETRTFFISISCCVIILIFLLMIYSLLSKFFLLRRAGRRNPALQTNFLWR